MRVIKLTVCNLREGGKGKNRRTDFVHQKLKGLSANARTPDDDKSQNPEYYNYIVRHFTHLRRNHPNHARFNTGRFPWSTSDDTQIWRRWHGRFGWNYPTARHCGERVDDTDDMIDLLPPRPRHPGNRHDFIFRLRRIMTMIALSVAP